jgi:hypothetical protein
MKIRFQDSYHIVNDYINTLDLEELKLLATLHNLNCVAVRNDVENTLLNNGDIKRVLMDLTTEVVVKMDRLVILSKIVKDLEEA